MEWTQQVVHLMCVHSVGFLFLVRNLNAYGSHNTIGALGKAQRGCLLGQFVGWSSMQVVVFEGLVCHVILCAKWPTGCCA